MRRVLISIAAGLGGCYGAEFDPSAGGVFACDADEDCPASQFCLERVCNVDLAPRLTILGPETLQAFGADETGFSLTLANADNESFALDEPGAAGDGHVRVWVDGTEITPVVSGDLAKGVTVDGVSIPEPRTGPHRIRAVVFDPEGNPMPGRFGIADRLFFVSDPMAQPMIAVVEPFPHWDGVPLANADRLSVGEEFHVEIAKLHIEWHNPVDDDRTEGQGHSHVFLLEDFPDCLPGCNYNYVASLKPAGSSSDDSRIIDGPAGMLLPTDPGRRKLSVALQHNNHFPYGADTDQDDEWTPELDAAIVYDQIEVEFFAEE